MNITINITEPVKRVQEFREYDLGQITTTLQDLLDNSSITIESNIIPILKVLSVDNIVKNYLIKDLTENIYNTQDYITGQDLTEDDLILFVSESQIFDLQNKLEDALIIQQSTFMGTAEPAATPTGTGNRYWTAVTPGTYTNFGGVVVGANSLAIISVNGVVWSISQTVLNLTEYQKKVDGNKILPWVAGTYASGDQVNHIGKDWVANAATLSTDIPGTSSKWVERLTGYVDKNKDYIPSLNLVDPYASLQGKYLDPSGNFVGVGVATTSDFIPVTIGDQYTYSSQYGYRLFDSNKNFVSGDTISLGTITIPTGVVYIRLTAHNYMGTPKSVVNAQLSGGFSLYKGTSNLRVTFAKSFNTDLVNVVDTFLRSVQMKFSGKKVFCVGDSYTMNGFYFKKLLETTGLIKVGDTGTTGNGVSLNLFSNNITTNFITEIGQSDIVTILGGTNDYNHGSSTLGSFADTAGSNTIYGSVKQIISTIMGINPNIKIVFFTQPERGSYGGKPSGTTPPNANANGLTMYNISEAIKDCCDRLGIACCQTHHTLWNMSQLSIYTSDNLHPNQAGADILGSQMGKFINQL